MKQQNIFKCSILLSVILLLTSLTASCKSSVMPENPVNNNVLSFRDFSLNAESVGQTTSVTGTIFVKGDKQKSDVRHIQITAQVEVDPQDWGGVAFYPCAGWKVTSVATDYPQGNLAPESYVTTLSSGDAFQVHIGNSRFSEGRGGGKGSVVIELDPVSSANALSKDLEIAIAVGSKGNLVSNPVSQKISVPLNINYRTPSRPPAPTDLKASSLTAGIGGQTTPISPGLTEFAQISIEVMTFIGGVDSQLTKMLSVADMQNIKQTTDYLEIGFDPPAQITTSQIRNHQWETVTLSSAIFFLGGEYYGLAAWPDANGPDRYLIYGSTVPIKELERLVKSAGTLGVNGGVQ